MNAQPGQPMPMAAEAAEPRAVVKAVPMWVIVLLFVLLYWGMVYFDQYSGWFSPEVYAPYRSTAELAMYQPPAAGSETARGKMVYESLCGLCHGNDGAGQAGPGTALHQIRMGAGQS